MIMAAKTFLTRRLALVGIVCIKSPTYFRIRAVAAIAVFALSLATAKRDDERHL